MQEEFEDWLQRKYGEIQLSPQHTAFARVVYEEEQLRLQQQAHKERR